MKNPYEDIINLPHHVSAKRPQMPMEDRAAQFSPFAALTGYDSAIRETARLTDARPELSEEARSALDRKLQAAAKAIPAQPALLFTYFRPDAKKTGGACVTVSGSLKKIDRGKRLLVLQSGEKIPLDDILDIDGELFSAMP